MLRRSGLVCLLLVPALAACGSSDSRSSGDGDGDTGDVERSAETGVGDSLYPSFGNPGYDVSHYTLELDVHDVATSDLDGKTTIEAAALDDLTSDFTPTFTVASTRDTTMTWYRDGVPKGTVVVGSDGVATFTDDLAGDPPSPGTHGYSVLHHGSSAPSARRYITLVAPPAR